MCVTTEHADGSDDEKSLLVAPVSRFLRAEMGIWSRHENTALKQASATIPPAHFGKCMFRISGFLNP